MRICSGLNRLEHEFVRGKAPASEGGRYKGKRVHLKVDATGAL